MKKNILAVIVVATTVFSSTAYSTIIKGNPIYINDRFGYEVEFPSDFLPQPEAENGDGRFFLSRSGDASIRISGMYCRSTSQESHTQSLEEFKENKISVTYKFKGKNYSVVSGENDKRIYYRKIYVINDTCTDLFIEYNKKSKEKYNDIIDRISNSLKPSSGFTY